MTTYYVKKNRRYAAALERDVWNGDVWHEGCHLVICRPGVKTIKYNIEPDDSAYRAAESMYAEKLASFFLDASKARCKSEILTQEQKEAWENMQKAFNGGPYFIEYDSALEMAKKFLEFLRNEQSLTK